MGDANLGPVLRDQLERYLVTGGELLKQNRVSEARRAFLDALDIEPDNVRALGLMGLACFRMNDFAGALPVYQRLVSLSGNDASYLLNLGLVHLKLGNAQDAIRELKRSRALDPSQSRAVSYLGLAHARNGEYANAYRAFLQGGQGDLAREMEQYLTEAQREEIKASVAKLAQESKSAGKNAGKSASPSADAAQPQARASTEPPRPDLKSAVPTPQPRQPSQPIAGPVPDMKSAVPTPQPRQPSQPVTAPAAVPATTGARPQAMPAPRPAGGPQSSDSAEFEVLGESDLVTVDDVADGEPATPESLRAMGVVTRPMETRAPGVISQAVAKAAPSAAATAGAARVMVGHTPPQSLSEFATAHLIRPEDGDHTFETSAGGVLIVRVRGRVYTRTEGVNVSGGELAYEVASRRVRGASTGEDFSADGRQLFIVSGHGHLIASPLGEHFTAVALDEDILYLREDLVYAFEEELRWENGQVPGSGGALRMVQFRGQGAVAFRSRRPLLSIKLAPEGVLYVDAHVLAGWIGRVIPRAVAPVAGGEKSTLFVECTGEGVVMIEDETEASPPRTAAEGPRPILVGARRADPTPSAGDS